MVVFMIVGKNEPIFEIELSRSGVNEVSDELAYLHQFVLFSSLDVIHSAMWTNPATYVSPRVYIFHLEIHTIVYLLPSHMYSPGFLKLWTNSTLSWYLLT